MCASRKVFLKHQVNWNTVCGAIRDLPWHNMYQPRLSVCITRINLGLMINTDMLLASSRRLIFGGHVIALELTGKSFFAVK